MGQAIASAAAAHRARPFLVRRYGRQPPGRSLRWCVVDQPSGTERWGTWSRGDDLLAAAEALADPVAEPPTGPAQPMLLVCTHALKDVCCAVRGRPVAAALSERWPELTWECSHTGGDRFAANLVVLPEGAYYGNLDPGSAVEVVQDHLRGLTRVDHLRGVSSEAPPVQAACIEALRRFGPGAVGDLRGAGLEPVGPETWLVRVTGTGPLPRAMTATVTRTLRPPQRLTCRAPGPAAVAEWTVTELRTEPG